jgi:hypothetical protein
VGSRESAQIEDILRAGMGFVRRRGKFQVGAALLGAGTVGCSQLKGIAYGCTGVGRPARTLAMRVPSPPCRVLLVPASTGWSWVAVGQRPLFHRVFGAAAVPESAACPSFASESNIWGWALANSKRQRELGVHLGIPPSVHYTTSISYRILLL